MRHARFSLSLLAEPLLQSSTNLVKYHVKKTMIYPIKTEKSVSITIIQLTFMSYIIHYCDDVPSGIYNVPFPFKYNVRESLYELQT